MVEKKVWTEPAGVRETWITGTDDLPLTRQCALAGVCRSTVYARQEPARTSEEDLALLRLIDEEYTRHPFYGSRRMTAYLRGQGYDTPHISDHDLR